MPVAWSKPTVSMRLSMLLLALIRPFAVYVSPVLEFNKKINHKQISLSDVTQLNHEYQVFADISCDSVEYIL